jgi:hypothetical protein
MGERQNAYRIFAGSLKEVGQLEITDKYGDNFKVGLR